MFATMIASPAAGEDLLQGQYACVGASQGSCGEGPNGICLGARIRRDGPNLFLSLDFQRNEAVLNGIHGTILRDRDGAMHLNWSDLQVLGQQRLRLREMGDQIVATLGLAGPTADFSCRRVDPSRQ